MARPRKSVHSSKKIQHSASKKKRRAAPVSDSESVASEAAALPVLADSYSDGQDSHGSGGSGSEADQPPRSPLLLQNLHRSPERNSPRSSPERADRSQERTFFHRSPSGERTSRQSQGDQSQEELQFVSHRPGFSSENFNSSDVAAANSASAPVEKSTASFKADSPHPPSRLQALEAPVSRVGETVNSVLLPHAATAPQQPANKHSQQRNPPASPVDPSRPATVHSRLPPAASPVYSRRINALEEDGDANPADGMRGDLTDGTRVDRSAEAAQPALLQHSGSAPPKLSLLFPAKVVRKEQQREGEAKPEAPASGVLGNSAVRGLWFRV
jgi:hypothetical protein